MTNVASVPAVLSPHWASLARNWSTLRLLAILQIIDTSEATMSERLRLGALENGGRWGGVL